MAKASFAKTTFESQKNFSDGAVSKQNTAQKQKNIKKRKKICFKRGDNLDNFVMSSKLIKINCFVMVYSRKNEK